MGHYTFSSNLKKARNSKRMTQQHLADRIGVAQNTICAWENDERYPTLDKVFDLARVLDVSVYSLVNEDTTYNTGA